MNHDHHTCGCGGHCLLGLIRARAYQLFESRGRQPNHAVDDWLQAECEIKYLLGLEIPCEHKPEQSC